MALFPEQDPLRPRPRWLEQGELPWRLLERFLDRLEQGQRLTLRIKKKTAPELYDFQYEDVDYLWELVRSLDKEFHLLSIEPERLAPGQPPYDNALLRFNPQKEALVRDWLDRPALDPYALVWRHQLARMPDCFEDQGRALEERIVRVPRQGAEATLRGFARLGRTLSEPITLRSLSARCFWGDSKFLDQREDLVRELFPQGARHLIPRPVLLHVRLPDEVLEQVLIVENQDTFLMLGGQALPGLALVHGAGYRASAPRLRAPGHAVFSYIPSGGGEGMRRDFEDWWFQRDGHGALSSRFWGDLDFAGLDILAALRGSFTGMEAWWPGYGALLARLREGWGHARADGGRERQPDPGGTGCAIADEKLLPALRESGRFVDQEAITPTELRAAVDTPWA